MHARIHTNRKIKTCNEIYESPRQKKSLKCRSKHQEKQITMVQEKHNIIDEELKSKCDLYQMQFPYYSRVSSLNEHFSSHMKNLIGTCHICGRIFYFKHEFEEHVKTHSKYKPFGCGIHQQAFSVENILKFDYKSSHSDNKV
ncbi:hypothetical protein CEXT_122471 [Caerostris extrusa]|uniref:C2H2-type domain-containing protein n=1 Tax=Caerostris extrusa TaxID=172846 RepID=A0AAV4SAQ4_CAEEX|nr:hypothetical protein CEXT_122471 [Caerostris extrusa]